MKIRHLFFTALLFLFACKSETEISESKNEIVGQPQDEVKDTSNYVIQPFSTERAYENYATDLGIGLIIAPFEFTLFDDDEMTKEAGTFKSFEELPEKFVPFHYAPEDSLMHFICLEHNMRFIKVLVNFDEVKYFKWSKKYKLKKWGSFIFQSFGVSRKKDENGQPLYENDFKVNNFEKAKVIEIPEGNELFCPVKINGEWLKVKYDCKSTTFDNKHGEEPCLNYINSCEDLKTGWIKWRHHNVFLINVFSNF